MRGALEVSFGLNDSLGIIPADAGSTSPTDRVGSDIWDHPRGCGEHTRLMRMNTSMIGSSPRMRGAHTINRTGRIPTRIIPADAGSTGANRKGGLSDPDHPRGCGEHISSMSTRAPMTGSSPRMRGAHTVKMTHRSYIGIIPADAGSTICNHLAKTSPMDHPRGCGEHRTIAVVNLAGARIIPADAGSTYYIGVIVKGEWDHPRGCGEHRVLAQSAFPCSGSSPRMRGALAIEIAFVVTFRIIPADAGSTPITRPVASFITDHPRGCGEH